MWSASFRRRSGMFHRAIESLESRRLFSAGDLDSAFAGGTVNRGFIQGDELAFSIALQSDGKVLLAGDFTSVNGINRRILTRLSGTFRLIVASPAPHPFVFERSNDLASWAPVSTNAPPST